MDDDKSLMDYNIHNSKTYYYIVFNVTLSNETV